MMIFTVGRYKVFNAKDKSYVSKPENLILELLHNMKKIRSL